MKLSLKQIIINFIGKYYLITRKRDNKFTTLHKRPKYSDECNTWSDELISLPKIGIIIQGPLIKMDDFTLETVKIYKKLFKSSLIILSTWEDENNNYLERIRAEGIEILQNKYPKNRGISNVNLQLISSLNGIKIAEEKGVEYILKTRTDQRIYSPNSLEYFLNLLEQFPVKNKIQKQRIIGVSLNTFKYRLYGLSDMTIFGNVKDMLLYWGANLDNRTDQKPTTNSFEYAKERYCEIYFVTEFLKKIGTKPLWTLKDSWNIFAKHFCVVDQQDIDLYWYKYKKYKEYRYLRYDGIHTDKEMTFLEWFNLYTNLKNKLDIPEYSQKLNFKDAITKLC